jgi:hypothetical protein
MVDITMRKYNVTVNRHIKGGYVIKATKSEGLLFIREREIVTACDLIRKFLAGRPSFLPGRVAQ